jgi:hypothetical protein
MLTPAMQDYDSQNLRDCLLLTVKQVKALHATLTAVMTDVAAMRRTLLEAPDDMVDYKSHLLTAIQTARPLVDTAMQAYDDLIEQLEVNEEWPNNTVEKRVS